MSYEKFQPGRKSFIYMWTHPDGWYYFGKRRGNPEDGYITSSALLKQHVGKDPQWKRSVLLITETEVEAYKYEGRLIRKHKSNPLCLNQKPVDYLQQK
jgi:hypothetical protein